MSKLNLGIDLGGTLVKMALVTPTGRVDTLARIPTRGTPQELARAIVAALALWKNKRWSRTGVGVAGGVDIARGVVRFAPNLRWTNVPLVRHLRAAGLRGPVTIDNDANVAAWGAYRLECPPATKNILAVTLGTGVGGGIVVNGQLYRGACDTAGELGHVSVDLNGEPCLCGARGCLEMYAGGAALVRRAEKLYRQKGLVVPDLTPRRLAERARGGDAVARGLWTRAGEALGVALGGLINVLNPEFIVLTGGLTGAAPLFLPTMKRELVRRAFDAPRRAAKIKIAKTGPDLGVVGAALL